MHVISSHDFPQGFVGNPALACRPDADECAPVNPCGAHARCTDLIGTFECACEPGCSPLVGNDARLGCKCPPVVPIDPCRTKRCGANALCKPSLTGVALCVCPPEYPQGDANVGCSAVKGGRNI